MGSIPKNSYGLLDHPVLGTAAISAAALQGGTADTDRGQSSTKSSKKGPAAEELLTESVPNCFFISLFSSICVGTICIINYV
jgi:hypothetical protein